MIWTIIVILFVLWLLGFIGGIGGGFVGAQPLTCAHPPCDNS